MKVLLDENLPHQLRAELPDHQTFTVAFMGWSGIENGALLQRAADDGFDVMITNDRGFEHEQNLDQLPVAVVLLMAESNTMEAIRPLVPALREALASIRLRQFIRIWGPKTPPPHDD